MPTLNMPNNGCGCCTGVMNNCCPTPVPATLNLSILFSRSPPDFSAAGPYTTTLTWDATYAGNSPNLGGYRVNVAENYLFFPLVGPARTVWFIMDGWFACCNRRVSTPGVAPPPGYSNLTNALWFAGYLIEDAPSRDYRPNIDVRFDTWAHCFNKFVMATPPDPTLYQSEAVRTADLALCRPVYQDMMFEADVEFLDHLRMVMTE